MGLCHCSCVSKHNGLTAIQGPEIFENREEDRNAHWKSYDYPFENLVFSGGGIKGYAYIGALYVSF